MVWELMAGVVLLRERRGWGGGDGGGGGGEGDRPGDAGFGSGEEGGVGSAIFTVEQAEGEKLRLSAGPPAMLGLWPPPARTTIASGNTAIYTTSSVVERLAREDEEEDENKHARRRPWVSKEGSSDVKLLESEVAAVPDNDCAWCARGAAGGSRALRVHAAALVSQLGMVQVMRADMDLGMRKAQAEIESIIRDAAQAESPAHM
nr:rRNA 2'-O-methyltransferase fibrillarin-like [Aegilops tauschii subsp. strangulata]